MDNTPYLLRQSQAFKFLSMSEPYFNQHVRPHLNEVKQGGRAVWYKTTDLIAWADKFAYDNGIKKGTEQS
ncbi:MAG: hypothetical protein RIQ94_3378 [Pseudomonadota bacterium]|jgi:hypothetical protein